MKKMIALVAALTFVGSVSAFAAGPETITLPAKKGNITFPHKKHQEDLKIACKECHGDKPGKIEGFNMAKGHALCKECHAKKSPDAAKCDFCHKK